MRSLVRFGDGLAPEKAGRGPPSLAAPDRQLRKRLVPIRSRHRAGRSPSPVVGEAVLALKLRAGFLTFEKGIPGARAEQVTRRPGLGLVGQAPGSEVLMPRGQSQRVRQALRGILRLAPTVCIARGKRFLDGKDLIQRRWKDSAHGELQAHCLRLRPSPSDIQDPDSLASRGLAVRLRAAR